jgi:hypothetical protein
MSLTAYIRYDSTGRLVPGGPIVVAEKPAVGNWQPVTQGTNVTLVGQLRAFVKLDRYNKPLASTLFLGHKRPASGKWLEVNATYTPQNATYYNVAGCERMEYHVIKYTGAGTLAEGTIVNNATPECWFIIDEATGTEDVGTVAYVWNTPNDCQPCINSHTTTTTTTTVNPYWTFTSGNVSVFPANSNGYTLYTDGFTSNDDGTTVNTFPLAGTFYTGGAQFSTAYLSTNGFMFPNVGQAIYGNHGDLYLTPGQPLDDGDIQNFWYQNIVIGPKWRTSMLIYCGDYSPSRLAPYSYVLNIYRDSQYQYIEAVVKTNVEGPAGPFSNQQFASTLTQVWRGDLTGTSWTYLGFGSIT